MKKKESKKVKAAKLEFLRDEVKRAQEDLDSVHNRYAQALNDLTNAERILKNAEAALQEVEIK